MRNTWTVWTVQFTLDAMSQAQISQERILNAAAAIVGRSGAAHLTIDAVAAEAGLSKGGVLYHFPNKRSMIEAMVQFVLENVAERAARHRTRLSGGRNAVVRSFICAEHDLDPRERAMSIAILAAAAEDPDLVAPARARLAVWLDEIMRDSDGDLGIILMLATEGLRFLSMLDLLPLTCADRERIHQRMLAMAEAGDP